MRFYFQSLFCNKSRQPKIQDDSDVGLLCNKRLSCLGILLLFAWCGVHRCCFGFCDKTRRTDLCRIILMNPKNYSCGFGLNSTCLGTPKIRTFEFHNSCHDTLAFDSKQKIKIKRSLKMTLFQASLLRSRVPTKSLSWYGIWASKFRCHENDFDIKRDFFTVSR